MRGGKCTMLVNGEWVAGSKGDTFPTIHPAHHEVLAEVVRGKVEDAARTANDVSYELIALAAALGVPFDGYKKSGCGHAKSMEARTPIPRSKMCV